MEIVCCLQLADSQVAHHLTPAALHPAVQRLWIVRSHPPAGSEVPKAEYLLAPARWKPFRFAQMLWHCLRLSRRKEVRLFVSFNPFPYGLIAAIAAWPAGKPVHFGFIGSDWHRDMRGRWGRWLLPLLRRAWLVSAPGARMLREIAERGVARDRLVILPHCLNIDRFPVRGAAPCEYDFVFVGRLIPLKRVDVILRAFWQVVGVYPRARLAIVGDGPLRPTLERLCTELAIADRVEFVGHVPNVQDYLARARIFVMASEREGLPYALLEAMCSGLVPVCTPVGEIPDLVEDGRTGFLYAGGAAELAAILQRLLGDEHLYRSVQAAVVASRMRHAYAAGVQAWSPWLDRLVRQEAAGVRP